MAGDARGLAEEQRHDQLIDRGPPAQGDAPAQKVVGQHRDQVGHKKVVVEVPAGRADWQHVGDADRERPHPRQRVRRPRAEHRGDVDAPADREQKAKLAALSPDDVTASELAALK